MAQRRMLSKVFTETDAFLDLSLEAQAVYLHLNVNADDDGFISNPRTILRMMGADKSCLDELIKNGFLIDFGKVVVLVDWLVQNSVPKAKYHKTQYQAEFKRLLIDQNGRYMLKKGNSTPKETTGLPNKNKMDTKRFRELEPELGLGPEPELGLGQELGPGQEPEPASSSTDIKHKELISSSSENPQNSQPLVTEEIIRSVLTRNGNNVNSLFKEIILSLGESPDQSTMQLIEKVSHELRESEKNEK